MRRLMDPNDNVYVCIDDQIFEDGAKIARYDLISGSIVIKDGWVIGTLREPVRKDQLINSDAVESQYVDF